MEPPGQTSSPPSSPPSSPLSVLSKSPSLPASPTLAIDASERYPSPLPSTPSGSESPIKLPDAADSTTDEIRVYTADPPDGPPPAKRRRIAEPKARTTQYVDLSERTAETEFHLERLLSALRKKRKIVVIAGAGISVSAGIPDFRSSTGLFATLRNQHKLKSSGKHLFDASVYKHDSSTQSFHTMVRELAHQSQIAKPTTFHHMLASLAKEGRLMRLYSQNIDCIDTSMEPLTTKVPLNAKGPWPTTIQLHGGIEKMVCTKCGHLEAFNGDIFDSQEAPLCEECRERDAVRTSFAGKRSHGIGRLRPRIVLYNEYNPDEEAIGNVSRADLKSRPDAVIVVGTSLKVPGVRRLAKEFCQVSRGRRDGFTAWINIDPEPQGNDLKECWDLVVRAQCDDVAELVALPRWDEPEIGDEAILSDEDSKLREARLSRDKLEVQLSPRKPLHVSPEPSILPKLEGVEAKPKLVEEVRGIPTPGASPRLSCTAPSKQHSKTKQGKLPFGGKMADNDSKPVAKKAKSKKPRQPKTAAAPLKNTVIGTFKAVKNPATAPKTPATKLADPDSSDLSSPLDIPDPFETPQQSPPQLPPLRPATVKSSPETFTAADEPPRTPTMHERRKSETISPKSIPRGMHALLE